LNFLKKQEQHNEINFIVGKRENKSIYRKTYISLGKIIPTRVILNSCAYEITYIDKEFHLDGFEISTENDKVLNVRLFGGHPNCDPDTDLYCLQDYKKNVEITPEYLRLLKTNIRTYYLDNCYFNPTGRKLRYEKMDSMSITLNPKETP